MVKSIIYTLVAVALCAALFIFTERYVDEQFGSLYLAAEALHGKVEDGTANTADVEAVRGLWEGKKSKLHIFIPHNDIAQIDYCLGEVAGCLRGGDSGRALAKLELVLHLAQSLPGAYGVKLENVF